MFNNEQTKKMEILRNAIIISGTDEYGLSLSKEKFLLLMNPNEIVKIFFSEDEVRYLCKVVEVSAADYEFLWKEPSLSKKEIHRKNLQEIERERAQELSIQIGFVEEDIYTYRKEKVRK